MTMIKRCDACSEEQKIAGMTPAGWATVTIYPGRESPGRRGEMRHLDLCPDCVGSYGLDSAALNRVG